MMLHLKPDLVKMDRAENFRPVMAEIEGDYERLRHLGGVGAGLFASIEEGIDTMVDVTQTIDPEPSQMPLYQSLYEAYTSIYGALAPEVFTQLNGLAGEPERGG